MHLLTIQDVLTVIVQTLSSDTLRQALPATLLYPIASHSDHSIPFRSPFLPFCSTDNILEMAVRERGSGYRRSCQRKRLYRYNNLEPLLGAILH
jgi:hypothetical protein